MLLKFTFKHRIDSGRYRTVARHAKDEINPARHSRKVGHPCVRAKLSLSEGRGFNSQPFINHNTSNDSGHSRDMYLYYQTALKDNDALWLMSGHHLQLTFVWSMDHFYFYGK